MNDDEIRYQTTLSRNWKQITDEILNQEPNDICVGENEMIPIYCSFQEKSSRITGFYNSSLEFLFIV